jgi:hypothetical protein
MSNARATPLYLDDGVYLNLDEASYHNASALGSGDIRRLAVSPPDFWFNSKMNPLWSPEDSETPAKIVGTATHVMVLYGADEFNRRYAFTEFPGNIKAGIAERDRIRAQGKVPIKQDDWQRIHQVGAIVRANPVLTNAFSGGAAAEVSVVWTSASGIQKKCRIDYLKQRASVDLKTITNRHENMDFVTACRHSIAAYDYPDTGRALSRRPRADGRLIADGRLFATR